MRIPGVMLMQMLMLQVLAALAPGGTNATSDRIRSVLNIPVT